MIAAVQPKQSEYLHRPKKNTANDYEEKRYLFDINVKVHQVQRPLILNQ